MTHYFRNSLIAGLVLNLVSPGMAESRIRQIDPVVSSITIRVYDYAGVPTPVIERAREETSRIFREAGIATEWASCTIPGQSTPGDSGCQLEPLATDIYLNILPRNMARKMMNHYSEFGAAFPLPNSFGSRASVFYDRIDELAESQGASRALLLGHFMAHEIGHLLLGVNSHSGTGLMHVPWDQAQREKAYLGILLFTEKEAERIRSQTAARVQAAQASTEPATAGTKFTVIVLDYADVPGDTLAAAQGFVEEVFRNIGFEIGWNAPLSAATPRVGNAPEGRPRFVLRVVPNSMIGGWATDRDLLGFSLVPANGEMGSTAGAYYERVEKLSRRLGGKPALVLGYVIAHELGHLLLGAHSHSQAGIMSYPFEGADLLLASQGRLQFTHPQTKKIRERFSGMIHSLAPGERESFEELTAAPRR